MALHVRSQSCRTLQLEKEGDLARRPLCWPDFWCINPFAKKIYGSIVNLNSYYCGILYPPPTKNKNERRSSWYINSWWRLKATWIAAARVRNHIELDHQQRTRCIQIRTSKTRVSFWACIYWQAQQVIPLSELGRPWTAIWIERSGRHAILHSISLWSYH